LVIVAVLVAEFNNRNVNGGRLLKGEVRELFNPTIIERKIRLMRRTQLRLGECWTLLYILTLQLVSVDGKQKFSRIATTRLVSACNR
jgi:hypothetical protein